MRKAIILAVICSTAFGVLCRGYIQNVARACDKLGCGHYGARRVGGRSHGGVDVKCSDGSAVYAPFDGKLVGRIRPYGNKNKIDDGFKLIGNGLCVMFFYIKPDKYTGNVKKGQRIGTMLPMQAVYPGITSHIHVQMCDRSNPTRYL
ncbi:leukocyte cell-derived chemotaxin-2-like [Acipenser ruthenus]|uniref:leukocyte cell-derived chemotaxin-2-like n=1 Tax=Acipenser ruthenus TaxID=7906 RepID=UPI0027424FB7|nr:leukocyte cell-derived chemotaxin-2-like [Acipenser ruthenus]